MDADSFQGKLALQQRVLPAYRVAFYDALASACADGLSVFAGQPGENESLLTSDHLTLALYQPAHNVHFFSVQSKFYRCYQPGIIPWLKNWQPDALIVEANPRYLSTPQALRWMHDRKRQTLGWGLGAPAISGPLSSWRKRARLKFLTSLDGVIAYSQRGAEEYRQAGVPAERVFVANNAVTPAPTHPLPDRPARFQGRPRLLFVGRLQERKRLDLLLQACAELPDELQPEVRIVGDGPARSGMESLARQIYPAAQFSGAHFGAELEADFTRADVFVLPGTGGLAVQQAMAYGLPVIVAQGDGTQDDLVRPGNGWQVPPDDLAALGKTLREALSDPLNLRQMGAASYRIVREEINLERMVSAFIGALNSLTRLSL